MTGSGRTEDEQQANLGRMQRLFNRGHLEEERVAKYLRGIGCELHTHHASGDQFRMSYVGGHYGGSLDGILTLPKSYGINEAVLWENKTNSTGKGFDDLEEKGLAVAKPQHFIQSSAYGQAYNLRYALYTNTNKNDDDIYIELVKLNWNMAEQFKTKAERIIRSQEPPPRLSETPTYFKCQYCDMKKICHDGAKVERNCRSCKFAEPVPGGEWQCTNYNAVIPRKAVPVGCPQYSAIHNAA